MCQYKDYQLVKRLQLRAVKYLKIVSINYKPYPEYAEVMTKALNNFIAAMSELIVNMYRANNPTLFKKDKYYTFIDTHTKIFHKNYSIISPLSHMVNESTYSGLYDMINGYTSQKAAVKSESTVAFNKQNCFASFSKHFRRT